MSVLLVHLNRYPSQLDSFLYLGDWANAENHERLAELNVKRQVGSRG